MAERPEEEMDDEDLLALLMSRMATAARATSTPVPKITRSDLTPEFVEETRKAWKEGPKARGERFFDQSPESKDFKRLEEFNKKAPERVRKIDYTEAPETHKSRIELRKMRAQTKGAQQSTFRDLTRHTEQEYRGFRMGKGQMSTSEKAGRIAGEVVRKGVTRLTPFGAAYTAWKAGTSLGSQMTPAGRRAGERKDRIEENEAREEYVRSIYPGHNDDFYKVFAKGMMDEDASPPTGQTMEEILRIMELQKEIEGIKDGPARELVKQERRGR
tara:strand:+ start:943 stop:1758 length:816 start_codon:yes stop_codon:yes gene_type:complete